MQSPTEELQPAGAPGPLPSHLLAQLQVERGTVSSDKGFLEADTPGGSHPAHGCRLSSRGAAAQWGCYQTA